MHCNSLRLQSLTPPNDPILFNSNPSSLQFPRILSQTPRSQSNPSSRSPRFSLRISHQPPRAISVVSGERRNQKRRRPWRRAVEKCVSFVAWKLRFAIAPGPLDLILDDGGWGGGFGMGRRKTKGFGGGSERRWDVGIVLLAWGWAVWLGVGMFGERDLGFRVLGSAVLGSWIKFWRSTRRKCGLGVWICVLGILILVVGSWRNKRLERIVEGFGDRFSVLERALKTTRRRRRTTGASRRRRL